MTLKQNIHSNLKPIFTHIFYILEPQSECTLTGLISFLFLLFFCKYLFSLKEEKVF